MSKLAWACAAFGYALAAALISIVTFDVIQVQTDRETISRWCLDTSRVCPFFPAVAAGVCTVMFGALLGHLFAPKPIGSFVPITSALLGATAGIVAGAYIGHILFAMRG
jgi:hypothetical protein